MHSLYVKTVIYKVASCTKETESRVPEEGAV
jgi:hypothetical protein